MGRTNESRWKRIVASVKAGSKGDVMHKKAKQLSKTMMAKGKKQVSTYEKRMGHSVDSAAHKRMIGRKGGY